MEELQALQDATRSSARRQNIENAWSNDININIPQTSISLGELKRYLRDWLGGDIHIGGDVVSDGENIILNVYGRKFAAKKHLRESRAPFLKLLAQAAGGIFTDRQPALLCMRPIFRENKRNQDAIEFYSRKFSRVLLTRGATSADAQSLGECAGGIEQISRSHREIP